MKRVGILTEELFKILPIPEESGGTKYPASNRLKFPEQEDDSDDEDVQVDFFSQRSTE